MARRHRHQCRASIEVRRGVIPGGVSPELCLGEMASRSINRENISKISVISALTARDFVFKLWAAMAKAVINRGRLWRRRNGGRLSLAVEPHVLEGG